jgi:hypothetical protein
MTKSGNGMSLGRYKNQEAFQRKTSLHFPYFFFSVRFSSVDESYHVHNYEIERRRSSDNWFNGSALLLQASLSANNQAWSNIFEQDYCLIKSKATTVSTSTAVQLITNQGVVLNYSDYKGKAGKKEQSAKH